jgi:hypothetical protein
MGTADMEEDLGRLATLLSSKAIEDTGVTS